MDGGEGVALSGAERGRNLMKAARWKKVIDLFQSALERAPEERAAFLDEACHDDEGMRREVESLLTSHERPPMSARRILLKYQHSKSLPNWQLTTAPMHWSENCSVITA